MKPLNAERLNARIAQVAELCATKLETPDELDKNMAIEFDEHFTFQELQAFFHASGLLTTDAAHIVYVALGEVGSPDNGGWAKDTDLPTKVVVTQLMEELLRIKLKMRGL